MQAYMDKGFTSYCTTYDQEEFDYKNFDYLQDSWERYEGDFVNDFKEG